MSINTVEIKKEVFSPLLRLSGFDPQTHTMTQEFRTGFMGPVGNLMRDLDGPQSASEKLKRLGEVSSVISVHFNKQGFAPPNGPATPKKVEEVLREQLGKYYSIPAGLKAIKG